MAKNNCRNEDLRCRYSSDGLHCPHWRPYSSGCGDCCWCFGKNCFGIDQECPKAPKDEVVHCEHWWDGDECCWCKAPAMTKEERLANGMED